MMPKDSPLSFRPSEASAGIHNPDTDYVGQTGVMDSGFARFACAPE